MLCPQCEDVHGDYLIDEVRTLEANSLPVDVHVGDPTVHCY